MYHGNDDPAAAAAGAPALGQELEVQGSTLAVARLDYTLKPRKAAGKYVLGASDTLSTSRTGR